MADSLAVVLPVVAAAALAGKLLVEVSITVAVVALLAVAVVPVLPRTLKSAIARSVSLSFGIVPSLRVSTTLSFS